MPKRGQIWSNSGQMWPLPGHVCQNLTKSKQRLADQIRANVGRVNFGNWVASGPILVEVVPMLTEIGPNLVDPGPFVTDSAQVLVDVGWLRAKVARSWAEFQQVGCGFEYLSPHIDEVLDEFNQMLPDARKHQETLRGPRSGMAIGQRGVS